MEQIPNFHEIGNESNRQKHLPEEGGFLSKIKKPLIMAGIMAGTLPGVAQNDSGLVRDISLEESKKIPYVYTESELDSLLFNQRDTIDSGKHFYSREDYVTKDGNLRYYHNPSAYTKIQRGQSGGIELAYSLGSTRSPFNNLEEMKQKTPIPQNLGEVDFFVNYINTSTNSEQGMIEDPATGNRYNNYTVKEPDRSGVDYEGEKHWNIQRFFIDPHYAHFHTTIEESHINAMNDIFKYFLYQQKRDQEREVGGEVSDDDVDRDQAWERASEFMENNVLSIVNSKSAKWINENYLGIQDRPKSYPGYYIHQPNWYSAHGTTDLPKVVLGHNQDILLGEKEGKLYGRKEIEDILVDYNIVYRKKTEEEAKKIAQESITQELEKIQQEIDEVKNRPITEYKVIKNGEYPAGFDSWSEDQQFLWEYDNPDKVKVVQQQFTEEDRQRQLDFLEKIRFVD